VQSLAERTAICILKNRRENQAHPWCRKMLERCTLPSSVHRHGPYRAWQRRFYDLNVWSEKKRLEMLHSMHGNPVKRRLGSAPDQGPWSSFWFYHLEDASILPVDRLP